MSLDGVFATIPAEVSEAKAEAAEIFDPFSKVDEDAEQAEQATQATPKPRGKYASLTLQELYDQPKITPKIKEYICNLEDFSQYSENYCNTCCKIKCKTPAERRIPISQREVDVLIIQEHTALPGKFDRREGQQEANQRDIITFICRRAGFAGLSFRLVELLRCAPNPQDFVKGKPPTATTMKSCAPYLLKEIEQCSPKAIISLSTAVTRALGLVGVSNARNRGEIVDNKYVLTIHPKALGMIRQNASGLFWGADFFNVIVNDFKKAAALARGELTLPPLEERVAEIARDRIQIATTLEQVDEIMDEINSLPEGAVISFDTETTSLSGLTENAKLLCIQFGWRRVSDGVIRAGVIPLWHRENNWFDPQQAWDKVAPFLVSDYRKVAHNGKFDILYIYFTTGVRVTNCVFDTMLLLHDLDSGIQGCYGLKAAAWDHIPELGVSGYETLLPKLTTDKELAKIAAEAAREESESEEESNEVDEQFGGSLGKNLDVDPETELTNRLNREDEIQ